MPNEVVVIPNTSVYKNAYGNFGTNKLEWHSCRELFHRSVNFWSRNFYFSCPKEQREAIVEFISDIENDLGLRTKTKISRTNIPTTIYISPARFWCKQEMRFSLFTILIRASLRHKIGKPTETAILNERYLKATYRAFTMFMQGRTWYTGYIGGGRGW